jgi:hypothetical protein
MMRTGLNVRWGAAILALAAAHAASGQASGAPAARPVDKGPGIVATSSNSAPVPTSTPTQTVREIDDPHSGARWVLARDPNHPAGPGRLVLAEGLRSRASEHDPEVVPSRPIIRAGDRLIVEENTAVAEARLEAVALGPAVIGSTFDVRLKIGGGVVRALAIAPGRAAFLPEVRR